MRIEVLPHPSIRAYQRPCEGDDDCIMPTAEVLLWIRDEPPAALCWRCANARIDEADRGLRRSLGFGP